MPVTRVVALLRAINVGGHTAKMDRLRALLAELGYARPGSYLASGNLFFDDDVPGAVAPGPAATGPDGVSPVALERIGDRGDTSPTPVPSEREAWRTRTEARLAHRLSDALGFAVPVFLRTVDELAGIVAADPFAGIELTDVTRFAVAFAAEPLPRGLALPVASSKGDMDLVARTEREAFVVWHLRGGRPPSGTFPPEALPASTTTRFFHTTAKILAAARRG